MDQNENVLHVLKAEITNFKNISHQVVELNGKSMIIAGPNQIGKSSLIQGICSPVNAKYTPTEPIKQGEEKGMIELTIGGKRHGQDVRYKIATYFTPGNKKGRLVLFDKNGDQIKGGERSILNDIIGDISFDIMELVRLSRTESGQVSAAGIKKQIEILKSLMPVEVLEQLHSLDTEKQTIYDERTEINRDIKYIKSAIEESGLSVDEIEKYSEPISVDSISEEIKAANEVNSKIDRGEAFIKQSKQDIIEIDEEIEQLKAKIDKLEKQKVEINTNVDKTNSFLSKSSKVDLTELNSKMSNISTHNLMHEKVKHLKAQNEKLLESNKEADKITARLSAIEKEKKQIFSSAKMPVKGLEFDEDRVTYKGLPLSEEQIPTSQLIGIGLKVGMALNPNLRLLVIRDGSLLDQSTMNFILKMCAEKDYQLLIELVDHDGKQMSIDFIERD